MKQVAAPAVQPSKASGAGLNELNGHAYELQATAMSHLIIGKKKHDVQKPCKLQLLLTGLVITLPLAAPASCLLASL